MTTRTYESIWNKIKTNPDTPVVVQCNRPDRAARIRKGVIREKYKDTGFKVINELDYLWLHIAWNADKNQFTFTLRKRYGIEQVMS